MPEESNVRHSRSMSAEHIIISYISDLCFINDIEQRAYAMLAAEEILKRVSGRPSIDPSNVVYEFILKTGYFTTLAKEPRGHKVFAVAYNAAKKIGYLLGREGL